MRDAITRYDELIDQAIALGHSCIAFTEHDCVSNAIKIQKYYHKIKEKHPDFKVILGNEIYLCHDELDKEHYNKGEDKFFHFILLAKDAIGHQQIREISTRAWMRSWMDGKMRRVPTHYQDLIDIIGKNPGHVIGSSACLGGFLPTLILKGKNEPNIDITPVIHSWLNKILGIFGKDNFYFELQPPAKKDNEQDYVNQYIYNLSKEYNIPFIITTDTHYLKKEDAFIHKAYLNSQNGEREVDSFYATTYLMDTNEIENYFSISNIDVSLAYQTIQNIADQCEDYDLTRPLKIPRLPWKSAKFSYLTFESKWYDLIPMVKQFMNSDYDGDKLLVNLIIEKIHSDERLQNQATYDAVNTCLQMTWESSEVNKTHWSAYFLNLQKIIDVCWEAGTIVGPGRGSGVGFILLYLLDITQINPLWETTRTFPWRFLNPSRVSVLDVDVDIEGSRRGEVLNKLRQVYGQDKVANVITFGSEKSKSAILTAARGLGIDSDEAQYISSLIPADRGQIRTLSQCYYGDKDNDFKPVSQFVNAMNNNPELWRVAQKIEGLVCRSGIHAGGVIFVDEPFTNTTALMRAPDGTIITAYDLHDSEDCSLIKYDLLSVEALDKIHICLDLLRDYNLIPDGTIKERYDKILNIYTINRTDQNMWHKVWNHEILSLFQMEKQSGIKGIATLKPTSVDDLSVLNSTIRLMAQEGADEMPTDKLARFKADPKAWDRELAQWGLGPLEKSILEPILKSSYGLCITQEQFMELVQLPELGGFSLTWADKLRKSIAKKNPAAFDALTEEFYATTKEKHIKENFAKYVWQVLISMSKGYGFNASHTLAYSLIALQEMNLATRFPIIYWNCACLINDSGTSVDDDETCIDYDELKDEKDKANTDYEKLARGIGKMKDFGVQINLVDINKSGFTFVPDAETNTIYCGLKSMLNINDDIVNQIIENRPYSSPKDFYQKVKPKRQAMISLIKGGAFDSMMEREDCMIWYIWETCDKKNKLTLQNMPTLINYNLLPTDTEEQKLAFRIYEFNKYLKAMCKNNQYPTHYILDTRAIDFLVEIKCDDHMEMIGQDLGIGIKVWDKIYQKKMDVFREWLKANHDDILQKLNSIIFYEDWKKYIKKNNYSAWEMEVLCFYYHDHELKKANLNKYGIQNFFDLPKEPEIEYSYTIKDKTINIYQLHRICGTCITKNKAKSIVTLLTPNGVVDVKFNKEHFSLFDKQISEKQENGKKKVMERSFFQRGSMIVVTGIRSDDMFICKKYKNTPGHRLYKIEDVAPNGDLTLRGERYKGEMEEDEL